MTANAKTEPAGRSGGFRLGEKLPKSLRITRKSDFGTVYADQQRRVGRSMVFWWKPRTDDRIRLGVVASRKVGPAVARARAKRLLREAFRRNRVHLADGCDVILVARARLLETDWPEITGELMRLARNAGLLKTRKNTQPCENC